MGAPADVASLQAQLAGTQGSLSTAWEAQDPKAEELALAKHAQLATALARALRLKQREHA